MPSGLSVHHLNKKRIFRDRE